MKLLIENISYSYGSDSFLYKTEISDEITGVFGFSGSGKTTLLKLICGIEEPRSGRLVFNNCVYYDSQNRINIPASKRNFGIVFQENYLFPHLSVRKNLLFSDTYKRTRKKLVKFQEVVSLLDISKILNKKPFELSGGERQRVAIGRSLLSQPELLLMDEPFSNLDRNRRGEIISYLQKIGSEFNIPLLIISHDLEDLLKLTPSLLLIKEGKISASGNYFDLIKSEKNRDLDILPRYTLPGITTDSSELIRLPNTKINRVS